MGLPFVAPGVRILKAQESRHEERQMSPEFGGLLHEIVARQKLVLFEPVGENQKKTAGDDDAEWLGGQEADDPIPAVTGCGQTITYNRDQKYSADHDGNHFDDAMGLSGAIDLEPACFAAKRQSGNDGESGGRIGMVVSRAGEAPRAGRGRRPDDDARRQNQMLGSFDGTVFGCVERSCSRAGRNEDGGVDNAHDSKEPPRASLLRQVETFQAVLVFLKHLKAPVVRILGATR